ncbi:MAG TPA: hypothetical protein VKV25_01035, partial [Acidimicrobiales bacterium]|nr:hypothetical protein [Acidimicrobiales bacterium]
EDLTRVLLQMEYKPTGAVEWVGNTLRIQRRRAKRDLRLFKHFVEVRGEETGAWRGKIDSGERLEPRFSGQGSGSSSNQKQGGEGQSNRSKGQRGRSGGGRGSSGPHRNGSRQGSGGTRKAASSRSGGRS